MGAVGIGKHDMLNGKADGENGAITGRAIDADRAVMFLDNLAGHGCPWWNETAQKDAAA